MKPQAIADIFQAADTERSQTLARARDYAALTLVGVLPPLNQDKNAEMPGCWTNTGGEGMENMVGRTLTGLFPVGLPWFHMDASIELRANPDISTEQKNAVIESIWRRELLLASKIETTNYRLAARSALESAYITGNALTRQGEDFGTRYYRFDNWVCKRSGTGQLLWTITREKKHPVELSEDDRAKAKIKADSDEMVDLYTRSKAIRIGEDRYKWFIEQEINGVILRSAEEAVNPYNCITYKLIPGEDYGRGFIETRFPDLKSANHLWQSLIFGMANAAKMSPVVDPSETLLRPDDLAKANGVPLAGRVVNGVIQGAAFLQTNKTADFGIAFQGAQAIEQRLGRGMMMESAAMPKGERVTATAVMRIAQEFDSAHGGLYAHLADQMQKPMLERTIALMERKALLPYMSAEDKKHLMRADILTGAAALSKQMQFDRLMAAVQQIVTLPGELARLDLDLVASRILYYAGEDESGVMKSAEQVAQEAQAQLMQGVAGEAAKTAISTIGELVTQRGKVAAEQGA